MALEYRGPIRIANLSRSTPDLSGFTGKCQHFPVDLTNSERVREVAAALKRWLDEDPGKGPVLLINNSGFGCYGAFPAPDAGTILDMLDLNVRAVVALTAALLPHVRASGGGIVNVASTAAFQPLPEMAAYAATKAFILNWGLALHQEIRPHGCFCLTLCPGPTRTRFFAAAGFRREPLGKGLGQTAEQVARTGYRAIAKRQSLAVSGALNRLLAFFGAGIPRRWVAPLTGGIVRSLRLDRLQSTRSETTGGKDER